MKKLIKSLILSFLVLVLVAGCGNKEAGNANEGKREFVTIVTGGTGGTYYPLGGAIADVINDNIKNVQANVESTGGSVANLKLLSDNKAQLGFVTADNVYQAYTGTESFEEQGPQENLRAITALYPEVIQVVSTKKAGIKKIEDLKGKKVAVGAAGSGTELGARIILNSTGITYDDIEEDFLSFGEVTTGLQDGNIAAGFVWAGVPTSAIIDLATLNEVEILSISDEKIEGIIEKYPFYKKNIIPANTYNGQDKEASTIATNAILVTTSDMDEETVYQMTKSIFENNEAIANAHARGKDITLESALDGIAVPLHPGAIKYYEEQGIEIPEDLKE